MSESRLYYFIREVYNHFNLAQFLTPTLKISNNAPFGNIPLNARDSILETFIKDKAMQERGVLLIGLHNYPMGIYTNEKIIFAHEDGSLGILNAAEFGKYQGYRVYIWCNMRTDIRVLTPRVKELFENIEHLALLAEATGMKTEVRRV